jgi:hypothetical protein
MVDGSSGVPKVTRPAGLPPARLTVPSRYDHQFPGPDDEIWEGVDQVEFGASYFLFVLALFLGTAGFAAFILVPVVGLILGA